MAVISDVKKLWLMRQTIIEMLIDRGYNVKDYYLGETEFYNKYSNLGDYSSLKMVVEKKKAVQNDNSDINNNNDDKNIKNDNDALVVQISDEPKISLKSIKLIIDDLERQNIKKLILISEEGASYSAQKVIDECNLEIDFFKIKELMFNVTKHILVPKHRIMSENEKIEYLNKRKISENELPKILKSDPVAKYFGARKGDVFEIERNSSTAGISYYYRIVI
ncbi:DNA-directed RNA polymerases I, II, and III subunit RPABC1 [Dictyocoela muelleri]|nr:DNA-directed RNA polymerases I, II, and III subunit RPABC1 [Dictyocoela muelleri]